jgi:hypothetical protein
MNDLQLDRMSLLLDIEHAVMNLLSHRAAVVQGAEFADVDAMDYWMDELERLTNE